MLENQAKEAQNRFTITVFSLSIVGSVIVLGFGLMGYSLYTKKNTDSLSNFVNSVLLTVIPIGTGVLGFYAGKNSQ